jgi:hypothetical protein
LANFLMGREGGPRKIREMIHDDIRAALAHRDKDHARELLMALRHFMVPYVARDLPLTAHVMVWSSQLAWYMVGLTSLSLWILTQPLIQ